MNQTRGGALPHARRTRHPGQRDHGVVLVGFDDVENLGLRYLHAYLRAHGVAAAIHAHHRDSIADLVALIKARRPLVVGFSLIFQRMLFESRDLLAHLRDAGITAHFTMGGHFPTLADLATLAALPALDSVVRGEGEVTLLALYEALRAGGGLGEVAGLTWRAGRRVRSNPPRELVRDLDTLPFPTRRNEPARFRDVGVGTLLASRGCWFDCSFCSIHNFYGQSPGLRRRSRSPGNVVAEMEHLFREQDVRVFIFEDDDFIARAPKQRLWLRDFCDELQRRGLAAEILWRVSCRVDDIDRDTLRRMRAAGLMCLYVGIESGSARGLATYNKHYGPRDVLGFVELMEAEDLPFEFGFMLFHPDCDFAGIRQDIDFLRRVGASGLALVHFTKMVPYAGTAIAERLQREGRLEGDVAHPDYRFLDERIDLLQQICAEAFHVRNFSPDGAVERLRHAKFDVQLKKRFAKGAAVAASYEARIRELIRRSNESCICNLSLATRLLERSTIDEVYLRWGIVEKLIADSVRDDRWVVACLDHTAAAVAC